MYCVKLILRYFNFYHYDKELQLYKLELNKEKYGMKINHFTKELVIGKKKKKKGG